MTQEAVAPPDRSPNARPWLRLVEALSWRWRLHVRPRIKRLLGVRETQWARVVMDRRFEDFMRSLDYPVMDAVEITSSGDKWKQFGFRSYLATTYPEYDLCEKPLNTQAFDVVIAEQVLEHVLWPYRAVRHVHQMLRPGGWFMVSTPFLLRVHAYPTDCTRWTEVGLKHLLMEGGFSAAGIVTGSWGNRACVTANFHRFPDWIPWRHSLVNEPNFPVVVWAFARKSD